jgi:inosine-uridine nucleoside N-ribohydrolase
VLRALSRVCLTLLLAGAAFAARPVPVIFDTDMGNDVDDALALAMLHTMETRGEVKLLAVTVTKDNVWAPRFVSAINTFYGRGAIPIGMVKGGVTKEEGRYNRQSIELGKYAYSDKTEEAVALLRRVLAGQADGSVVMVQVGFSTNLARLAAADRAFVAKKVKLLVLMAGNFVESWSEYNIKMDIAAARTLARDWPTPRVWSGFEVGRTILYPRKSIDRDFAWAPRHPVVDAFHFYMKQEQKPDRETWDLTAVLYAVRPEWDYFGVSAPGKVTIDERGASRFAVGEGGQDRMLTLDEVQRARVLEAFIGLASQPPCR